MSADGPPSDGPPPSEEDIRRLNARVLENTLREQERQDQQRCEEGQYWNPGLKMCAAIGTLGAVAFTAWSVYNDPSLAAQTATEFAYSAVTNTSMGEYALGATLGQGFVPPVAKKIQKIGGKASSLIGKGTRPVLDLSSSVWSRTMGADAKKRALVKQRQGWSNYRSQGTKKRGHLPRNERGNLAAPSSQPMLDENRRRIRAKPARREMSPAEAEEAERVKLLGPLWEGEASYFDDGEVWVRGQRMPWCYAAMFYDQPDVQRQSWFSKLERKVARGKCDGVSNEEIYATFETIKDKDAAHSHWLPTPGAQQQLDEETQLMAATEENIRQDVAQTRKSLEEGESSSSAQDWTERDEANWQRIAAERQSRIDKCEATSRDFGHLSDEAVEEYLDKCKDKIPGGTRAALERRLADNRKGPD